jgi:hypothetical protein
MIALTSNITKIHYVSRTTIYRANYPTIYARVYKLNFHCIYCQPLSLVEFPLYTQPCKATTRIQSINGKSLSTKTQSINQFLKPSKLLPHWHQLPKWAKNLEGQYCESSSIRCAFLNIWVKNKCTYPMTNTWRKSNNIKDPRIAKWW